MDRIDLAEDFTLVIFGVSMAWTIYSSMDHYPRINRFGHLWERNPLEHPRDLVVIALSWTILGVAVGGSLYSIFFTFEHVRENFVPDNNGDPWLIPALGVMASYYVYLPYLANRLLIGSVLLAVPGDFIEALDDPIAVRYQVLPRISLETLRIWTAHPRRVGAIVSLNSGLVLAFLLILTPNVPAAYIERADLLFFVVVSVGIVALLFQIPYGRWLKPSKEGDQIVARVREVA